MINLTIVEQKARKRVCLALDGLDTLDAVRTRVEELSPVVGLFKIGKESYTRFGPDVIRLVQSYNANVFLDLKYHDIPNTVEGAAKAAAELGVYMFNVHASGGKTMLQAAVRGAQVGAAASGNPIPKIIGVTVLTSLDDTALSQELGITESLPDHVLRLAKLTAEAGLDGIVCSPTDLSNIRKSFPSQFMYVTPGISGPATAAGADQARTITPGNAINAGSTILVIGRAITAPATAEDRLQAGYAILRDMALYMGEK